MTLKSLTTIQRNILIASIMGDGEITKIYKNSRRKNHSYREHYGEFQEEYRKWKASFFPDILYLTPKSHSLRSASSTLFTELYPHFYNIKGNKQIPQDLLHLCDLPHFLAILYMDDGTLSITKRINRRKKLIYLTPNISLYLQSYPLQQLKILQHHIFQTFHLSFKIKKQPDGCGHILCFTSTRDTYNFLNFIQDITIHCPNMYYKTNWNWRYEQETVKLLKEYPEYKTIASHPDRIQPYTELEITSLISLKKQGHTIDQIANKLQRTYWSIVYKMKELKKDGLL